MTAKKIAIYALTTQGLKLANRLADPLDGTVYASRRLEPEDSTPFDSLSDLVSATFHAFDGHVFVAAAGIVVRCIASQLQSKETDPAVVCLDQEGEFAVSLLSGHLGGANELAIKCAGAVGGKPVITTATDSVGVLSVDTLAVSKGLVIGNIGCIKGVNMSLLEGHMVQLYDPEDWLGLAWDTSFMGVARMEDWKHDKPGVWVSWRNDSPEGALALHPRVFHLGVGCRRDVHPFEIIDHIYTVFKRNGLSLNSIASLASVEAKRNEPGLLDAAHELGVDPVFFSTEQLAAIRVPNPSDLVQQHMNVPSVAEASALRASHGGELIVPKEKTSTVTLAIARSSRA